MLMFGIDAILIIIMIALFPFMANALAQHNLFFTTLESGDIKFVMRGETLRRIIYDVPKDKLKITEALDYFKSSGGGIIGLYLKKLFRERFGLYWIGFPPFTSIHTFFISKERENPEGKTVDDWIEREDETLESSLRFSFPRPFSFKNVELGDRIPVHVLVMTKFEVVDPYLCIFLLKGKFFRNLAGLIQAKISDILKGEKEKPKTLNDFISDDKAENSPLFDSMMKNENFNNMLIEQVGIRLVGISIPKYDPGDESIREAMNAATIAKEQGEATIVNAEIYKKEIGIRTKADVSRIKKLAGARKEQVLATVEALSSSGGSKDVVAQGAANILEMEAATGEHSKITTLVKDGTKVVVPTGGK